MTGAAGMIGSNLVRGLNAIGVDDVIAVDDLSDGSKYRNLVGARLSDYFDKDDFYGRFARREFGRVDVVLHQGACSDTMEHNGRLMLDSNYRCSRNLLDACQSQGTRLLYASSAAIYGGSATFREHAEFERPLNVYGYSKLLFDNVVRSRLGSTALQVAGFRYFNVYGPREQHKGRMASVAFHNYGQFRDTGSVRLFGAYGGYASRRAAARLRVRRRRRGREPVVPGAPRPERSLQPGHRPRAVLQRGGARHGQRLPRAARRGRAGPRSAGRPEARAVRRVPGGAGRAGTSATPRPT